MTIATTLDFEVYNIVSRTASACSSLSPEATVKRMNQERPTGIKSRWRLSKAREFSSGEKNPCPCNLGPKAQTHKHYLMEC